MDTDNHRITLGYTSDKTEDDTPVTRLGDTSRLHPDNETQVKIAKAGMMDPSCPRNFTPCSVHLHPARKADEGL